MSIAQPRVVDTNDSYRMVPSMAGPLLLDLPEDALDADFEAIASVSALRLNRLTRPG